MLISEKLKADLALAGYDEQVYNSFVKQNELPELSLKRYNTSNSIVLGGFTWADSEEGHDFWENVFSRLIEINK